MPEFRIPVGDWAEAVVDFINDNFVAVLDGIAMVVNAIIRALETGLLALPVWLVFIIFIGMALWRVSWRFAIVTAIGLVLLVGMNLWNQTMTSLALVLGSTIVTLAIGIPLGIAAARSDRVESLVKPVLDLMQTMPSFVYLIPAAMFFGLGKVPGAMATIIFSMPPAVRLTNLGIRHVQRELVEAGIAFGCTRRQLLFKVQIPNAMPSIMAGVNQAIMLALSMVVIASMIGAGGLGNEVLRGIQRLDIGLGFEAGFGVVVLAILLDRITQSFGQRSVSLRVFNLRALTRRNQGSPEAGKPA